MNKQTETVTARGFMGKIVYYGILTLMGLVAVSFLVFLFWLDHLRFFL